jgi:hypothetical protein
VRVAAASLLLAALALGSCGGDDSTSISTTTGSTGSLTSPTPTSTTSTASTTSTETAAGGGTPQPGSGSGAANAVIAAAAVLTTDGTTEEACGSYVTEHFIQTAYGGEANCVAARQKGALAHRIAVGRADFENATRIVVEAQGGPYDGAKITVDLVVEDDAYRVDALDAHVPAGP